MNDIGKELYERVRAGFEKRLESAAAPKDMRGVSDYSRLLGRCLAEAIAENVTENALPDRRLYYNIAESILAPALRTNYDLVNDTAAEVQRLIDERQGLRIKPARADYPEERVHAVIGAASEEGIDFDRALRRMTSPAENITASFADDFMKANAEQRSKAGFDTFIERQGGFNCCPWCAGLVGVYAYPKEVPKDVYCRHDNCTCSVTYGTKGGARQNVWTKAKWNAPPVQEPHRMTAEEAAEKGGFDKPKRLTGGANGGIIGSDKLNWLTAFGDGEIIDIALFKQALANGQVNTSIYPPDQRNHLTTPEWKNQVKQALANGGKPKSRLYKSVDPQSIVDLYSGTGIMVSTKKNQVVDEFMTMPFKVGVTYDKKLGRYVETHRVQIKYTKNGTHVFPVIEGGKKQSGTQN